MVNTGRSRLWQTSFAVAIFLAAGAGCAPASPPTGSASVTASPPSGSGSPTSASVVHMTLDRATPALSGPLAIETPVCDDKTLAWGSIASGLYGLPTEVWVWPLPSSGAAIGAKPRRIAQLTDGGEIAAPAISGDWVIYVDFHTVENQPLPSAWSLIAVNQLSLQSFTLADATTPQGTAETPEPAISGTLVAWDQILSSGEKALVTYDLATGERRRIPLPVTMYPFEPHIDGHLIIFLDVSTDPHRAEEHWLGFGGSLVSYDLQTGQIKHLDSDPDARGPAAFNGRVTWLRTVPDPQHPDITTYEVRMSPEGGGPSTTVAAVGQDNQMSDGDLVAYYDQTIRSITVMSVETGRQTVLELGDQPLPAFRLCGHALYFSLPRSETEVVLYSIIA